MASYKKFQQNDNNLAISYYRYSSRNQNEASIDQQREEAQKYAEAHGLKIIREYADEALTGRNDDRPQFQQMISDLRRKVIRPAALIVWKTDRIARNRYDSAVNKKIIRDAGCEIYYVAEAIPTTSAEGDLMEGMMESLAEYYSKQLSTNVNRGMRFGAEQCLFLGHSTFGYKPEAGKKKAKKIEVDPDTAPVVQRIFADYAKGKPLQVIANELNAQGIRTSRGKNWNINGLRWLLHNEAYTGLYRYADIVIEDGIPALITKAQFAEVQERFVLNKRRGSQIAAEMKDEDAPRYWLTGKLFCGHCKEAMQGVHGTSKTGAKHYYYSCAGHRRKECQKKPVRKSLIEYLVVNALRMFLNDSEIVAGMACDAAAYYKSYYVDTGYLEGLEAELKAVDKALDNLIKSLENGYYGERLQARMEELEIRRKGLADTIEAERMRREAVEDEHTIGAYFRRFLNANLDDPEVRDMVLDSLVDRIYLYDNYFEIIGFYTGDRTVIEWNDPGDKEIQYSGYLEPSGEFADIVVGRTKSNKSEPIPYQGWVRICCLI